MLNLDCLRTTARHNANQETAIESLAPIDLLDLIAIAEAALDLIPALEANHIPHDQLRAALDNVT